MCKIKFYFLTERNGTLVRNTRVCSERHTANTSQDPFEVFQQRYPTAQDVPRSWRERDDMESMCLAVLSRGWMPEVRNSEGNTESCVGPCNCIITDWENVV
jgi:hypothetical protein